MFLFFTLQKQGAREGILTMLSIHKESFYNPNLWHSAAADVLTSLGIATGAIFVFASFNPLRTPLKG
ncbi:hypothetical protein V5799_017480, partial [Amblyomma americanum]